MQWLPKSASLYVVLFVLKVRRQKQKDLNILPPLKVQSGSHSAFLMMYNVCWQGLFEECELIFRSIERSVGEL